MINTDKSAKELLDRRVAQVNSTGCYENAIYCGYGEYADVLRRRGHVIHRVDTPRGLSPLSLLVSTWKTFRLLRKHRYDIIHTHGSVIWFVGAMAALLARVPCVVHQVHGFHHHANMNSVRRWLYILWQRGLSLLVKKLLFQNKADVDECLRSRIAPARKLVLVGNGIQLDESNAQPQPCNDPPVILCVSRFEPVKNHGMVLDAARLLRDRGECFVLNLAGDGELIPECEAWVREHALTEKVRFLGYRDDVPSLTLEADVCVLVSIKEGLPRAIIEAAACGRPMVATDVVGNRNAIVDGVTGFLVPLNDAKALADQLQTLLHNPGLRKDVGERARAYARTHFDERKVTERIMEVYDQLAEQLPFARRRHTEANM